MKKEIVNVFTEGMNTDINDAMISNKAYPLAYNVTLVNNRMGVSFASQDKNMAVSQRPGDVEIDLSSIIGNTYRIRGVWRCMCYFGTEEREAAILIATDPGNGETKIIIIDATTDLPYLVYDDAQAPTRDRIETLNVGEEIDSFTYSDSSQHFFYWIDQVNPLRYIPLKVTNTAVTDNSTGSNSPLFIANEPDLLYAQKLWPVDQIDVASVEQTGGGLRAGSYQFAYQYFNSTTKIRSCISLISNPVPVILSNTTSASTNEVEGGGPGHNTGKSIKVQISKSHFHHLNYDSIILYIVKRIGSDVASVDKLAPSTDFYGTQNAVSEFTYTGNESVAVSSITDVTVQEAAIKTAKTIQEQDGRLYLANVETHDLDFTVDVDVSGQTTFQELPVSIDPMVEVSSASGQGYYDEMNCYSYRSFIRGEVERFAVGHVNKFGHWSRSKAIKFPSTGNRYNSASHGTTFDLNWAETGVQDWKFLDRKSTEGSLFSTTSDSIKAMGLTINGLRSFPTWSYGMAIFKRPRIKNIVGQSPLINGMGINGGASAISQELQDSRTSSEFPWIDSTNWDYDGSEDTIVPRVLAHGAYKNIFLHAVPTNVTNKTIFMPLTEKGFIPGIETDNDAVHIPVYYLYPLEYLANDGAVPYQAFAESDGLKLEVIDVVAMDAFTSLRRGTNLNSANGTYVEVNNQIAYIYSPKAKTSWWYYNHGVGNRDLLTASVGTSEYGIQLGTSQSMVSQLYTQTNGGGAIITNDFFQGDQYFSHINKLDNLQALYDRQVSNADGTIADLDLLEGNTVSNQRALIVKVNPDTSNQIYDVHGYLTQQYGTTSYSLMFPGASAIQDGLINSSGIKLTGPTIVANDYDPANRFLYAGTSIPIVMVNITRGLGDDRYGAYEIANEYEFTGSYAPISKADIDSGLAKAMTVWGDSYITRNICKIRDNAPNLVEAGPAADENRVYYDAFNGNFVPDGGYYKVSMFQQMTEIIDVWCESEVNGHHIFRNGDTYPFGFDSRPTAGDNSAVDYQYPDAASFDLGYFLINNIYNNGYSGKNDHFKLFSVDLEEVINSRSQARVHHSQQRINDSSTLGFDSYLPLDYFDLSGTYGGITKIVTVPGKRILAIQEDAIAEIFLGQTVGRTTDGFELQLQSGQVIGYSRYLSSNNDSGGDFGGQDVRGVITTEMGTYVYDKRRSRLIEIGSGIKDIGYSKISKVLDGDYGSREVVMGYDGLDGRLVVFGYDSNLDDLQGIFYLNKLGIYEGVAFSDDIKVTGMAFSNGNNYVTAYDSTAAAAKLFKFMANQTDRTSYFGYSAGSVVYYMMNAGSLSNTVKSIFSVEVQAANQPTSIQPLVWKEVSGSPNTILGIVPFAGKRRNSYFFNQFRNFSNLSEKLNDPNLLIGVRMDGVAQPCEITTVKTNIKVKTRT